MRALLVIAALLTLTAGAASQSTVTFRGAVRTVSLYVTVQDRDGHLVPDLQASDFDVRDNGRRAPVTLFSSDLQPITMVLLIDMSGSMASRYRRMRDSMLEFVEALLPADRVRIGTFGERILFTPFLTSDKEILRRLLHYELWPGGASPLWKAMSMSLGSIAGEPGRRVVMVVTDGEDTCREKGCVPYSAVESDALAGEMLVYAVGMAGYPLTDDIVNLARKTGGGAFKVADDADLTGTFRRVADELHRQYLIGFTPIALDGKRHTIDVRMRASGMKARTRRDYLAPKETQ